MKRNMLCALVPMWLALITPMVSAQTGMLVGNVIDDGGKPVGGAVVIVIGTSPVRGAITKPDGSYRIAGIRPGVYDLKATAVGLTAVCSRGISIGANVETRVGFTMTHSPIRTDPISVLAQRSLDANESSETISDYDIQRSARTSIQEAIKRNSGVTTAGAKGISIHGGRASETTIRVDGDPFTGGFGSTSAVSEVQTISSGFGPEYGDLLNGLVSREEITGEEYNAIAENRIVSAATDRVSTFSIDVDAASYTNIRRFVEGGALPQKDAVRVEEMINYFTYDYPQPGGDAPFAITTEVGPCPWNSAHELVRIGLQGRRIEMGQLPPNNLVFLIDVSGSMGTSDKLPLLQSGLRLLVNQLRREDRVAIVVYAGAAGEVLPPTSGGEKEKILDAISNLEAGGSTAGEEGINLAYTIARKNYDPAANNRVILCTDGDFNVGVADQKELAAMIERKRKEGVALTVLGFGTGNYKDATMEMLADKGNGNYAYIDRIDEARRVLVNELGATLFTIAKDVKIQVEFNPARVATYRLIGYENRVMAREDFHDDSKDAGELGAGHAVTALYEIVPTGAAGDTARGPKLGELEGELPMIRPVSVGNDTLLFVKLRYKPPTDSTSRLLIGPVLDGERRGLEGSDDFRHAAAVAELGMLLRDSEFRGSASYDDVIRLARGAQGIDADGSRRGFIRLAERCRELANAPAAR